jgi:hypothetical protein
MAWNAFISLLLVSAMWCISLAATGDAKRWQLMVGGFCVGFSVSALRDKGESW